MAPISPDNTPRVYIDYTVGGEQHTMTVRVGGDGNPTSVLSTMAEYFAFMDSILYTTTIDAAWVSAENSNVRLPITWPGDASYGSETPDVRYVGLFISYVGKSVGGIRWRLEHFGIKLSIPNQWRMLASANAALEDGYSHIRDALLAGVMCAIDGQTVIMNSYVNFKVADNEVDKARRG